MPKAKPGNKKVWIEHECDMDSPEVCPDHPDLILLRDAAADERNAIAFYLEAAVETCLDECFLHVARDEMCHYLETMRLVSCLDPVQAEAFREQGLDMLVMGRPEKTAAKWQHCWQDCSEEDMAKPVNKKELTKVKYLTQALEGELKAINKYQTYMEEAKYEEVKVHFCELMNDEKEHVAEFTACLYKITNEPPEACHD